MQSLKTLTIIGPGRLGSTVGRVLHAAGAVTILDVVGRDPARTDAAVRFIGAGAPVSGATAPRAADIYMLSVPDDAIEAPCQALAATHDLAGAVVFHCSGALGADKLASARAAGAVVASVHPVRSFADPAQVAESFAGTCCGVEGDAAALDILLPLFESVGARMIRIDAAHKTLYHAAAVFASNYVVTLIDVAMQAYGAAGVSPDLALEMIGPLLRESADNALRLGPAAALTGPVARGDIATVARQQAALDMWKPGYAALYREFAEATALLAASRKS
jgi:predicted short-subunit dehydrogenase-like oxidoreductase (DUF2520 family)